MNDFSSSKKAFLDYLFYEIGKQRHDFYLSGLKKIGDEILSTRWMKYSEIIFPLDINEDWQIAWINQRQVLPNEVCLDLEDRQRIKSICQELDARGITYYAYDTGSRGYHVHLFFDRELSSKEKLAVIKHFGGDVMKSGSKTMIALEFCPHWKSGKIKRPL